jgi:pyruvate dehydrogenase E1 component beta subunit
VIFLENEVLYGQSFPMGEDAGEIIEIGKAQLVREGSDITIATFSIGVGTSLKAADALAAEGIQAEVIDLRTLRPLDTETIIRSVMKTNRIMTVEEGWPLAGMGAEIGAIVMEEAFDYLDAPVARITGADVPMPYAANLIDLTLPQPQAIVEKAKELCYRG